MGDSLQDEGVFFFCLPQSGKQSLRSGFRSAVIRDFPGMRTPIPTGEVEGFLMGENGRCGHPLFARPGEQKPSRPKCCFHPLESRLSALGMSAHFRWHFLGEPGRVRALWDGQSTEPQRSFHEHGAAEDLVGDAFACKAALDAERAARRRAAGADLQIRTIVFSFGFLQFPVFFVSLSVFHLHFPI